MTPTARLCAAALAAVIGSATLAAAEEVTLRAGVFVPLPTTYGEPFKRFVDHVNETGKGVLQIRVVGGPEAIPPSEQANAVSSGVLDIASIPPAYYKGQMVEGDAQLLTDMTLAEQRASGAYAYLDELAGERFGATYLTTYGVNVPFHIYTTKEITSPEDLEGMRIRAQPNYGALFRALGIESMTIAPTEVFTALERGVIDGYGWPVWGIQDFGWDKMTRMRVDPGFYSVIVNVLMNKAKYESLTDEQQQVLTEAAAWFEKDMESWSQDKTEENLKAQADAGITSVDFGPEFRQMAADRYWEELAEASPEPIAKLRALLSED
ncbi:TRAP transporter substrate-binding protein DctP [Oceanicella sp. SM1341]|uniref:TRAP transporter substrate-binding protein DctP n=1 Tax=Oceanicella sp. SM1341 TaxID=1548889 RepID=UPI000E4F5F95|nr:TRAP transporter substrate-binding protein DctP [Oceanicella sp. SM1341]